MTDRIPMAGMLPARVHSNGEDVGPREDPDVTCRMADLDGDGEKEVVALVTPVERDTEGALCVLARDGERWVLRGEPYRTDDAMRSPEFLVGDLDGDGREEVRVRHQIVGGWIWGAMLTLTGPAVVAERKLVTGQPHQRVFALRHPKSGALLFVSSGGHVETNGGKATLFSGAIGVCYGLYRYEKGEYIEMGEVYTPLRWDEGEADKPR